MLYRAFFVMKLNNIVSIHWFHSNHVDKLWLSPHKASYRPFVFCGFIRQKSFKYYTGVVNKNTGYDIDASIPIIIEYQYCVLQYKFHVKRPLKNKVALRIWYEFLKAWKCSYLRYNSFPPKKEELSKPFIKLR